MGNIKIKAITTITLITITVIATLAITVISFYYLKIYRRKEGVILRVITRHGYDILEKARVAFLKSKYANEYNIKDIMFMSVDPSEWIDIIRESVKEPGRGIDVAWGGGPTLFDLLSREGLLAPIESEEVLSIVNELPREIAGSSMVRVTPDEEIMWVASAISSFGLTINKEFLKERNLPIPQKWISLINETYAITLPSPCIGTADPTASTSNTRMFEIILQIYGWRNGWKVLTLIAANAVIYSESGLVRDAVMRGDVGVGTTIDFYGYTAQLKKPGVCLYLIPKDGSIVNGDPIALLRTSEHPDAAQAFIAWVLSVDGQKLWLDENINRMPINPKVFNTPEGNARPDLKASYEMTIKATTIDFNESLALSYEEAMRWFFHATLVQAHNELQTAWRAIAIAKLQNKITIEEFLRLIDELADPVAFKFKDPEGQWRTFTTTYAKNINNRLLKDSEFKTKIVQIWRDTAKARYTNVLEELKRLTG